ncbi:MAG: hypothetical protein ACTSRL_17870 [Candidatus Helarchaeota archaeon]
MKERGTPLAELCPNEGKESPINKVTLWLLLFVGEEGSSQLGGKNMCKNICKIEECSY